MRIITADINTSHDDLSDPGASIIQLAYIIEENGLVIARNRYFSFDTVSQEMYDIHSLEPDILKVLSGGKDFGDNAYEISQDFDSSYIIITHGMDRFLSFMKNELKLSGFLFEPEIKTHLEDTEQRAKDLLRIPQHNLGELKKPSLKETIDYLGIDDSIYLSDLCWSIFKERPRGFEDAIFKTTAIYEIAKHFRADLRRIRS